MLGVFGGTFNPVHYGHLRSAVEVKQQFSLTEVRLVLSAMPPHRDQPAASAAQRLAMLKLAVQNVPGLTVDGRELSRPGFSYMVDTLLSIRHDYPEETLLLFIGLDAFLQLQQWYQWQRLFDLAHIVVLTRPCYERPALADFFAARLSENQHELNQSEAGKLYFQPVTALDISATAIRAMVLQHRSPQFLLPDSVIDYIHQHALYQNA